jgi:hypothetical protein
LSRVFLTPTDGQNITASLTALWLPILLSAVLVFVASSIIHMASRWHSGDWRRFSNEDAMLDALRFFNPIARRPRGADGR